MTTRTYSEVPMNICIFGHLGVQKKLW